MSDWVLFFVVVVGIPVVAGVARDIYSRRAKLRERELELGALRSAKEAALDTARVERLEARVAVLERIATDRGTDLAFEIERLRTAPLN